jgi:hypothetical protein
MMNQLRTLVLLPGRFAVCRLDPAVPIPGWAAGDTFVAITRTIEELSVVCRQEQVPADVRSVPGWRCFRVAGTLNFALTGVLASLTLPLARHAISVFTVSTFDTDYLLIKEADVPAACTAWREIGWEVRDAT